LIRFVPVLFAVFWTSVLAWSLMSARLAEGLKSRHPLVHQRLERPALAPQASFGAELALLRFLLARRYAHLGDPHLERLAGWMRQFLLAYAAFFLAAPLIFAR
jgi:hypothetical protein